MQSDGAEDDERWEAENQTKKAERERDWIGGPLRLLVNSLGGFASFEVHGRHDVNWAHVGYTQQPIWSSIHPCIQSRWTLKTKLQTTGVGSNAVIGFVVCCCYRWIKWLHNLGECCDWICCCHQRVSHPEINRDMIGGSKSLQLLCGLPLIDTAIVFLK